MDDAALRTLALTVAQNRTPTDTVQAEAQKLYDWMLARGDPGSSCVVAANNKVTAQDNVDGVIATATDDYAFLTGGDGSPVMPWPPEQTAPPAPLIELNQFIVQSLTRAQLIETIAAAQIQHPDDGAEAIADAIIARGALR